MGTAADTGVRRSVLRMSSGVQPVGWFPVDPNDDHLADLVVKVSASGAEDPGFESRFFRVKSYQ